MKKQTRVAYNSESLLTSDRITTYFQINIIADHCEDTFFKNLYRITAF